MYQAKVIEHHVFFLKQNTISRSSPVLHPSPQSSSTRTGVVANPVRPADSGPLDPCADSPGKGKAKLISVHFLAKTTHVFITDVWPWLVVSLLLQAGGQWLCGAPHSSLCWLECGGQEEEGTAVRCILGFLQPVPFGPFTRMEALECSSVWLEGDLKWSVWVILEDFF